MAKLKIYHGSESLIERPCLDFCRSNNDYGRGFYCTEDLQLAKEWACQKGSNGFANEYELSLSNLKIIDLNSKRFSLLNWLAVLFENRLLRLTTPVMLRGSKWLSENYHVNLTAADVVTGYRADDSYFSYARAFLSNSITLEQVYQAVKLGNLGIQIMCKSEKAIANLRFVGSVPANANEYFPKYDSRDCAARKDFERILFEVNEDDTSKSSQHIYLSDLMDMTKEEIDDCLQTILSS